MNSFLLFLIFVAMAVAGCLDSNPKSDKAILLQEGKLLHLAMTKYEMSHAGSWPKQIKDVKKELQKLEQETQTEVDLRRWIYQVPDARENIENNPIVLKGKTGKTALLITKSGDIKWEKASP